MKTVFVFVFVSLVALKLQAAEVKILKLFPTGSTANEIKIFDNKLYVAAPDKGILEINLLNNSQRILIPHGPQDDAIEAVEVFNGNIAYVVNGHLFVRNLNSLELVKKMNLDVDFYKYSYSNDMFHSLLSASGKMYVSTKFYGLLEVTLKDSQIKPLQTRYATKSIDYFGSTIVSADNCGLSFVNPNSGTTDFLELNGCDYRAIKVVGKKALIGSCRGLTVVDLATRTIIEPMIEMPACVGGIDYDENSNLFYLSLSGGGKAPYSQGVIASVLIKNL